MAKQFDLGESRKLYCPNNTTHTSFVVQGQEYVTYLMDEDACIEDTLDSYGENDYDLSSAECQDCGVTASREEPDWYDLFMCFECGDILESDQVILSDEDGRRYDWEDALTGQGTLNINVNAFCSASDCAPPELEEDEDEEEGVGELEPVEASLLKAWVLDPESEKTIDRLLGSPAPVSAARDQEPWIKDNPRDSWGDPLDPRPLRLPSEVPAIKLATGEPPCPCTSEEQMSGHRSECKWIVWKKGGAVG